MKDSDRVVELRGMVSPDDASAWISNLWTAWQNQRAGTLARWKELDEYLYATDTTTTSNQSLPWTHQTTTPKLTQIRDNLHSNYISSLFPNDKWLTWVGFSKEDTNRQKAKTLTSYIENKTREGGFRDTISLLLYDYIDKGNAFAMPTFSARYKVTDTGRTASFIGPKAVRISPYDIVFNPTATSFERSPKIVRSTVTLGELRKLAEDNPEESLWDTALDRRMALQGLAVGLSADDWNKSSQYAVDGFGSLQEYYRSDVVEVLEFYGDYHDALTGELSTNRMITVVDRSLVVRDIEVPTYDGEAPIYHVGWRKRGENLWAMSPLDNLVGMQYLIDHYTNMAANALDLKIMPPKKVLGEVPQFNWMPNEIIHLDENGDVQEMAQEFGDIHTALRFIEELEMKMELYAGAPREAMGVRTPGEKTAFEVQALENAAGRIFQEKITQFEIFMEQVLNSMLEVAHRNFDFADVVRVVDEDLGVQEFREITKEDITANGVLRPIGARHFAQKAQELQNLLGVVNSPLLDLISPHMSGVGLTDFINDVIDLRGYNIFRKNIGLEEAQELQALQQQSEEDNMVRSGVSEEELMMQAEEAGIE